MIYYTAAWHFPDSTDLQKTLRVHSQDIPRRPWKISCCLGLEQSIKPYERRARIKENRAIRVGFRSSPVRKDIENLLKIFTTYLNITERVYPFSLSPPFHARHLITTFVHIRQKDPNPGIWETRNSIENGTRSDIGSLRFADPSRAAAAWKGTKREENKR